MATPPDSSHMEVSPPIIPNSASIVTACREGNSSATTTALLVQTLESVVDPASSLPARSTLTETVAALAKEAVSKDTTPTNGIDAVGTFSNAFASAVWWLSCAQTNLSSDLIHVIQGVVEAATAAHNVSFGLSEKLLRSIADCSLLQSIGVLDGTTDLQKRLRVMNTSVNFRQYKFNLLSEETEGYSKFLYFLHSTRETSSDAVRLLHVLIGTYSLDPNRCLDLTIDVLEETIDSILRNKRDTTTVSESALLEISNHGHVQFLRSLVEALHVTHKLAPLLGFKLRGRLETASTTVAASTTSMTSLLQCMSWLCLTTTVDSAPLLDASEVLPYLPDESANVSVLIQSLYLETLQSEQERLSSVGRVRLTSTASSTVDPTSVDVKPLEQLIVMKWIQLLLQWGAYTKIQSLLTRQEWSDVCVLFPETIGVAIVDSVDQDVPWALAEPWSSNDTMDTDLPSMDTVLSAMARPLAVVMESGCISRRPIVYCKMCRLLASLLRHDTTTANETLVNFLRSFLVPSLCVFNSSPALSMELWSVLEQLPYRVRYSLYATWKGDGLERASLQTTKPLWLMESELLVGKSARYALKRLSKDTISDMSRAVAKCCHSHPLVVFTTILNQIEAYDNLVQVMVDACRFVTPLSLDVLGFCILQRLSSSTSGGTTVSRTQVKENGVNVAQWLQSLESFTGAFYKSFPHIEFQGILCYLMQRLKDGHVMELGVLRTLLKNCAGWSFADYAPAASLSSTQLEGRAGSTQLKRETMTFGVVSDMDLMASNQVRRVLQADNIGVSLLILLAQVRHQIVFQSSSSDRPIPVKLIGNLVDTSQVVMAILLDFLTNASDTGRDGNATNTLALERYSESLPPLLDLFHVYKLDVQSVWMLCRPLVGSAPSTQDGSVTAPYRATAELRDAALPPSAKVHFSTDLFECFFSHNLYDILCPGDLYHSEIARLEKEADRLVAKVGKEMDRHKHGAQAPVQPSAHPEKPPREELDRVKRTAIELRADYTKQKDHVAAQRERMLAKTSSFFVSDEMSRDAAMAFFVRCVYPRCMQGPDDAMFCGHFVSFLHHHSTPGFGTLHYFDCAIITLVRTLYCVTEGEAACASILLLEIWKTVSKWRYDEAAFEAELAGKPGSFMVVVTKDGEKKPEPVTPQAYEKLYNKWHAAIGATCIGCLQSTEYMHLRCSLVVLTRLVESYPTRPKLANSLLEALEPLQKESNAFADIRASAQAYSMQLLRSRDGGVWKEEDAATVEARLALVEAAAAERQKKAAENMKQLKHDSEQITEQMGESDSRDRNSRGRGTQSSTDYKGTRSFEADDHRRGVTDNGRRRGAQPLSPDPTDDVRAGVRQPPQPRDPTQHIIPAPAERRHRDRVNSYASLSGVETAGSSRREETSSRGRSSQDDGRKLEGRWQKAADLNSPPRGTAAAGRKRSRPSSPAEQGETREDGASSKRTKGLPEEDTRGGDEENPGRRSGGQRRRTGRR